MNNNRRQTLRIASTHLMKAQEIIDNVCGQETDALYNVPENLESSSTYETIEANVDLLEDASQLVSEAIDKIHEAIA